MGQCSGVAADHSEDNAHVRDDAKDDADFRLH